MTVLDTLGLTRLLQLASPALPVGAYSYSQGLEWAIESGIVTDAGSVERWIHDVLQYSAGSFDAPVCWRLMQAWERGDVEEAVRWNAFFRAGRETAELRAETLQMGQALDKLLMGLPFCSKRELNRLHHLSPLTFPAAFSFAAHGMGIESHAALVAYLWSWLENQVMAAMKAVPLGQNAGQRVLASIGAELPEIAVRATQLADDELSNFTPGLAIASCQHETQYSRLFRS